MECILYLCYVKLLYSVRNIEWPGPDDDPVEEEAKDLILGLLFMNPSERLGAQGICF